MEEKTTEEKSWEQKSQCECFYFLKNKFFEILKILKTKIINYLNKFYSFIDKTIIYFKYLYLSFKENLKIFIIFLVIYWLFKVFLLNYILIFWAFFDKELLIILFFLFLSALIYFWKKFYLYFKTLIISKRSDIFMTYVFIFHIIYNSFNLEKILYIQYLVLFLIINFIRFLFEQNIKKWLLISDKSIDWEELPDELWFQNNADNFANIVYNNWSTDNQIFWLVAEWWAWKTSFLNLFKNNTLIKDDSIYIEFNPWYYENEKDLLEKFLENIISNLKSKKYYLPKLNKNFNAFLKILDDNSQNFFWLKFWFSTIKTLDEIIEDINDSLKSVNKKIIIVIDDLDRIPSKRLKEIFKIVDLCRNFYNTSYILCYDPMNFNSIDDNLVQTYSEEKKYNISWNELDNTKNIQTQKVDNSEITRYMSKIITVYYPLIIDKEKLREYFMNIFTDGKNIKFSNESIDWIKIWINKLLEIENYRIWWKYYSNIRAIKRILNNLIITSYKWNQSNYIANLFNKNSWGLDFDIIVKFSILKLYFNHLYKDIELECLYGGYNNKYVLKQQDEENIDYIKYLWTLNINEKNIIENAIPKYNTNGFFLDNKKNYIFRSFWNINKYIDIENTSEKSEYNSYFIVKIEEYKNTNTNFETLTKIFQEINEKYELKGCNDFVIKFTEWIKSFEENIIVGKWIDFLNFILTYKDFYAYNPDFRFEFTSNIINIFYTLHYNNISDRNLIVKEFIYWIDNKNSFVDTIINFTKTDLKLEWLLQLLLFIRWLHKDNWGYYNTFMELLKTDKIKTFEEVRTEYCDFLFNKLKEHKYFDDNAIFSEMLDFEIKNDTNQITYWLQNLLWSLSDENKKEFAWYLKTWFENNINFFLNYFLRYLTTKYSENFRKIKFDAEKIKLDDFYLNFDKDYLKTLLDKKSTIDNSLKIDFTDNYSEPLIYPSNLSEVFELFEKSLNDNI